MAKSKSTRRKARKPRLIDVDGHKLTPEQLHRHNMAIETRRSQGYIGPRCIDVALEDVIHEFRPSKRAEAQLQRIYTRVMQTSIWVGHAAKCPWFNNEGKVRAAGVEMLNATAAELRVASAKISRIAQAIAAEDDEKLQQWNQRNEWIDHAGEEVQS